MEISKRIITTVFFCGVAFSSATAAADPICEVALKSGAFNTEDFAQSTAVFLRKRDDVCQKDYSSQAEATTAARSSGGSFGYGGYSLGLSDAKQTSNGRYSIKDSKYCRASTEEVDSIASISMKRQMADIALREWGKCIEITQANKLYVQYTPIPDGTGVTGTVIRKVGSGAFGEITGIASSDTEQTSKPITCRIGTQLVETGKPITIKFEKTKTNFSCTKEPARNVSISLTTNQDDQEWILLPSAEQQKQAALNSLNDSINALKGKIIASEEKVALVENRLASIAFQSGTFAITENGTRPLRDSSKCPEGADAYRGEKNGRVEFLSPFTTVPKVMVALSKLDISGNGQPGDSFIRLAVNVDSVDTKGFSYSFVTWCTTKVYGATASWTAVAN